MKRAKIERKNAQKDPEARLQARTLEMPSGCIEWQGYRTQAGYGVFGVEGKYVYTHRYVFARDNGPIPEGYFVMHKCDNPPCCNPEHLTVGTPADNVADRNAKGRQARGERSGVKRKLTVEKVRKIREMAIRGVSQSAIAEAFEICQPTVSVIVSRKTWAHVD